MNLNDWATKWHIPIEAVEDLQKQLGLSSASGLSVYESDESEAYLQAKIRIEACRKGSRLWRNNVGACYTETGAMVRYGLANDSRAVNKMLKSADLIGIKPVIITESMMGKTIGQFLSREVKKPGWEFKNTEAEQAQLRWANLILSLGGDAEFTTGVKDD